MRAIGVPEQEHPDKLVYSSSRVTPMRLSILISLIAGAISCYFFGGWVQAHNPFLNDFRVQAYGIAFAAGFVICRLSLPLIGLIVYRLTETEPKR